MTPALVLRPSRAFQTILGLATQIEGPTYKGLYAVGDEEGVHPNADQMEHYILWFLGITLANPIV
mgnify:CR=1 FL=1